MPPRDDLLRAIERSREELRARPRRKKKPRLRPGRPARTGKKTGCGTGDGGFGIGNNCAKEDGVPNKPKSLPKSFAQGGKSATAASLPATKEALAAKAATLKSMAKDAKIGSLRKKAAIRKKEKQARDEAEKAAAAAALAKKREQMLKQIKVKKAEKASEQLNVVGTPKSVAEQLAEAKTAMKQKTEEASKKLAIAGTPKSLKQEIEEAKLRQASGNLKVVGTPKSIKEELDELKAKAAAEKKQKAEIKKAEKDPPEQGVSIGKSLLVKQSNLTEKQKADLEGDKEFLFGAHLKAGWSSSGGVGSEKIRVDQKRSISRNAAEAMEKAGIKESDIDDDILKEVGGYEYLVNWNGKDVSDQLTKQGIPPSLHRRYALSAAMVNSWANTSTKSAVAVGIQLAIKDEFKIKGAHTRHLNSLLKTNASWASVADNIRRHKAVRAVLRAHHQATQAYFKSKGIKEITLVRGYKSSAKINASGEQDVPLQPASSFSVNKITADGFSGVGKTQRLLTTTVPAERVLSMCTTGFGCMHEQELVVLGGIVRGRLVGKSWDW